MSTFYFLNLNATLVMDILPTDLQLIVFHYLHRSFYSDVIIDLQNCTDDVRYGLKHYKTLSFQLFKCSRCKYHWTFKHFTLISFGMCTLCYCTREFNARST